MKTMSRVTFAFVVAFLLLISSLGAQTTTTATDLSPTDTSSTTETTTAEQTTTEQTTTYFEDDDDNDPSHDAVACGICGGVGLLFFVLPLAISIAIAWWIYRDANQRGNPQAVLWAVLGFFFNVIGLIIYLIARPPGPGGPPTSPTV